MNQTIFSILAILFVIGVALWSNEQASRREEARCFAMTQKDACFAQYRRADK